MNKKILLIGIVVLAALVAAGALYTGNPKNSTVVKIGVISPMTGPAGSMGEEVYGASDSSFRTQITKLKGAKIDILLYIPTSDKAEKIIFQQMQTLAYNPHIVGDVNVCGYPINPKDFGITQTTCFNAEFANETAEYKQFITSYKNHYGVDPSAPFYDAITYDIILLIEKFSHTNYKGNFVTALKKHLLGGVKGQMSTYTFTPDGEVIADQYLRIIEK